MKPITLLGISLCLIIVLCLVEARPDNEIQNALDGGRRRGDRDRRRDRERGRQDDRDDRDRRRDRERERDRDRDDDEEPDDDFDNDVNALPSDRQRDRSDRERDRGDRERSRGDRDRQRDRGDRDQDRDRSRGRERDRGRERQRERERERQSDGQCTDRPKNFGCDLEPICRSGETLSVTFNTTCDKPIFKIARHGHDDNDKDDRKRRRRDECIDTEVVEEVEDTDADVTVDGREFDAYESERSSNHRRRGNRRGRRDKGGLKELKRLCRDGEFPTQQEPFQACGICYSGEKTKRFSLKDITNMRGLDLEIAISCDSNGELQFGCREK